MSRVGLVLKLAFELLGIVMELSWVIGSDVSSDCVIIYYH